MQNALFWIIFLACGISSCEKTNDPVVDPVDPVVCDQTVSAAGEILEACFVHQELNIDFDVFRETHYISLDLEMDGEIDLEIKIEDETFGIAGNPRGEIHVLPETDDISIAQRYFESFYCSRYYSRVEPYEPFYEWIDSRPCDLYTQAEIDAVDTILVVDYSAYLVDGFTEGEMLSDSIEWTNEIVMLRDKPYNQGGFGSYDPLFIMVKKMKDLEDKYGWVQLQFRPVYGTAGEVISTGMME